MAQAGNARGPNTKKMRSAGIRKKLQLQLEEGTIDLISFQQANGGCILTKSQPTVVPVVPCTSVQCSHVVIFGKHYDRHLFEEYKMEEDRYRQQQ